MSDIDGTDFEDPGLDPGVTDTVDIADVGAESPDGGGDITSAVETADHYSPAPAVEPETELPTAAYDVAEPEPPPPPPPVEDVAPPEPPPLPPGIDPDQGGDILPPGQPGAQGTDPDVGTQDPSLEPPPPGTGNETGLPPEPAEPPEIDLGIPGEGDVLPPGQPGAPGAPEAPGPDVGTRDPGLPPPPSGDGDPGVAPPLPPGIEPGTGDSVIPPGQPGSPVAPGARGTDPGDGVIPPGQPGAEPIVPEYRVDDGLPEDDGLVDTVEPLVAPGAIDLGTTPTANDQDGLIGVDLPPNADFHQITAAISPNAQYHTYPTAQAAQAALQQAVQRGDEVFVTYDPAEIQTGIEGSATPTNVVQVVAVDPAAGTVTITDGTHQVEVPLDRFLAAWQDGDYELASVGEVEPPETNSPTQPHQPHQPKPTIVLPVQVSGSMEAATAQVPSVSVSAHLAQTAAAPAVPPAPPPPASPPPEIDLSGPESLVDLANERFDGASSLEDVEDLFTDQGIEASVRTDQSVDDLQALLDDGEDVLVAVDADELLSGMDEEGGADTVLKLVEIDEERGVVILERSDGSTIEVPLDNFLEAWEDSDNALVEGDFPQDGEPLLSTTKGKAALAFLPVAVAGTAAAGAAVYVKSLKRK